MLPEYPFSISAVPDDRRNLICKFTEAVCEGIRINLRADLGVVILILESCYQFIDRILSFPWVKGCIADQTVSGTDACWEPGGQIAHPEGNRLAPIESVAAVVYIIYAAVVRDLGKILCAHIAAEAAADLAARRAHVVRHIDADVVIPQICGDIDDLIGIHVQIDVAILACRVCIFVDLGTAGEVQLCPGRHSHSAAFGCDITGDAHAGHICNAASRIDSRTVYGPVAAVDITGGELSLAAGLIDRAAETVIGAVAAERTAGDGHRAGACIANSAAVAVYSRVAAYSSAGDSHRPTRGIEHTAAGLCGVAADSAAVHVQRAALHIERAAVFSRAAADGTAGNIDSAVNHEHRAA